MLDPAFAIDRITVTRECLHNLAKSDGLKWQASSTMAMPMLAVWLHEDASTDTQSWWFGWTDWRLVSYCRFFNTCSVNILVIVPLDEGKLYITTHLRVFEWLYMIWSAGMLWWSIVQWSPPYLVSRQWGNGNTGIITLRLHFVLVVTLYLL